MVEVAAESSAQSLTDGGSELSLRPQDSLPTMSSIGVKAVPVDPEREKSVSTSETEPGPATPPTQGLRVRPTTPEDELFSRQLEQQFLHAAETRQQLEQEKQASFKIHDLLRNPELAAAAWQEMAGADADEATQRSTSPANVVASVVPSLPSTPKEGQPGTPVASVPVEVAPLPRTVGKCAAELLRDRSTLDAILADANAEYKINDDISRLLIARLKAGRQALEAQHAFVVQFAEAEAAAANVLRDTAVPTLDCDGDPGPLHAVAVAAAALPASLTEPRRAAAERLAAVAREIASAVTKFRSAADALSRACGALNWMADKKRSLVARAYATHEAACAEADRVDDLQRRGQPTVGTDADPWGTQAVLAAAENGLLLSQQTQRGVVGDANEQVERLEKGRMAAWQRLLAALLQTYGPGGECESAGGLNIPPLAQLAGLHDHVNWASLMDPMTRAVEEGRRTASNMQAQAQETAKSLAHDLFSSAEIIRQGPLDRWNASTSCWVPYHAVLTRRGMLHVCRAATVEGGVPLESIPLRLMDFDGVASAVFSMLRQQSVFAWLAGRPTKVVLRAPDAQQASQWILDVKDQMGRWSGRPEVRSPIQRQRSIEVM